MSTYQIIFLCLSCCFVTTAGQAHDRMALNKQNNDLNVLSYEVSITPAMAKGALSGIVDIRFQLPVTATDLLLDAGSLQIDSVRGKQVKNFAKEGKKLRIALRQDRTLTNEITIYYHGSPNRGLLFDRAKEEAYTVVFASEWMV